MITLSGFHCSKSLFKFSKIKEVKKGKQEIPCFGMEYEPCYIMMSLPISGDKKFGNSARNFRSSKRFVATRVFKVVTLIGSNQHAVNARRKRMLQLGFRVSNFKVLNWFEITLSQTLFRPKENIDLTVCIFNDFCLRLLWCL